MASATKESIAEALRAVRDPASGRDVAAAGYLRSVAVCDGVVRVQYQLPANVASEPMQAALREQTAGVLGALAGVQQVNVDVLVAQPALPPMPGVKHVIAVGAGKGGVGKSTVAVLAAVGLQRRGYRTGLLDADVYGPSIPKLTGTDGQQPQAAADGRIVPPRMGDVPILSMGHMVPPDQAIVWRGPMAQKYVKEFIDRGAWGELDYLIVDLPPGTGDIPLTLAQSIPLTGAVVVCTPQDVALLDAVKALRMYQKLGVDVLGIVENMSYYLCPHCGHRDEIFSHGGAQRAAADLGVPYLGGIPLNIRLRQCGDAGKPSACFESVEPYVLAALEAVMDELVSRVAARERDSAPAPTLRVR